MSSALSAQPDRLDAGSFTIWKDGQRVGREQFSFRKAPSPDGTAFELRAETTQGEKRVAMQLTTDSLGGPIRYSVEVRNDANVTVRLGGQRVRGRFATLARTTTGESAREYLLSPGAFVVESDLFHQLALVIRGRLAQIGTTYRVSTISPLDNAQGTLRLSLESGSDTVTIAGVVKAARRWRLDDAAALFRLVWADADGRILRVTVPYRHIQAIRDDVPRQNSGPLAPTSYFDRITPSLHTPFDVMHDE